MRKVPAVCKFELIFGLDSILLYSSESAVESCDEVVDVLGSYRETDSCGLYSLLCELCLGELRVSC